MKFLSRSRRLPAAILGSRRFPAALPRSRRFPAAGRWVGVAIGLATIALGERAWRVVTRGEVERTAIEAAGERHGRAHVADGDSVAIGGTRLRLVGIDAPELAQVCRDGDGRSFACGETAKERLEALIDGRPLDCRWERRDKYGRGLATCRVGGTDLGAAMVRDGWAVAYGGHEAEEAEARRRRRGLWAGAFEGPEDFRRRERGEAPRFGEVDAEGAR